MELGLNSEVGKYVLKKKLGHGSSGYVWLATDTTDPEQTVVVKIIPLTGWRKHEFEREIAACENIKHQNVVRLYESFILNKHGILVMEKLDRDLLDFLDDYTITEAEARTMFIQILEGVHFLHINCTAHMDIKPENILIRGSDTLKVADLGSAFKWEKEKGSWKNGKAGTSFYCAPEVKSGNTYLADKADIWSLGITLHVMLTGFWPYLGQTEKEVLSNARRGKVDLAEQYLSEPLRELLINILQIEPTDRPTIPEILRHRWFAGDSLPQIAYTPRSAPAEFQNCVPATGSLTDPEDDDAKAKGPVLEELTLEGLKSPRFQQMLSPRDGADLEGGIRPSPRGPIGGAKQTKLGKLLHSVRKGFGTKKQK